MALLSGQTAVVTGGARGLGRAVASKLASEGASVWICSRTAPELEETAQAISSAHGCLESRAVDLSQERECLDFIAEVQSCEGQVDVLVNNAGILSMSPLEELESLDWSLFLSVNLTAPYLLTRAVLPSMKDKGGSIINVSSRAGVEGFKNEAAYCATKFGLEGFTRALACELKHSRVSVNTMTPGLRIKPTSVTQKAFRELPEKERMTWNDPMKITPAFVLLARLRGEVSGQRFDAHRLSEAICSEGLDRTTSRLLELAE